MSHWSQDAQSKDGKGMRDQDAGDPVQKCEERVKAIQVLDYTEQAVVDPEVKIDPPAPPLETSISSEPAAAPLEHDLRIVDDEE